MSRQLQTVCASASVVTTRMHVCIRFGLWFGLQGPVRCERDCATVTVTSFLALRTSALTLQGRDDSAQLCIAVTLRMHHASASFLSALLKRAMWMWVSAISAHAGMRTTCSGHARARHCLEPGAKLTVCSVHTLSNFDRLQTVKSLKTRLHHITGKRIQPLTV